MPLEQLAHRVLPSRWFPPARYHWYRLRGRLEPELALATSLVRRGDHVVDVGASWGVYTHALAARGARVEAFEPFPACAAALAAYAATRDGVRVHEVALSDRTGTATLHVPRQGGAEVPTWGSLRARSGDVRQVSVPVRPLDAFGFSDVRLVKIDVEGEELAVLHGARATIERSRPVLVVEVEQRHHEQPVMAVLEEVVGFGYHGFFLLDGTRHPLGDFDPAIHQRAERADGGAGPYVNNFVFEPR